jgi:hypothetical protein
MKAGDFPEFQKWRPPIKSLQINEGEIKGNLDDCKYFVLF